MYTIVSTYLCANSHRENLISLVSVNSAETRPIGKIGCNDCVSSLDQCRYFQNIPMDWKSDPLDRAGGPSPKATPQMPCRDFFFGVALLHRYKGDLHKEPSVTARFFLLKRVGLLYFII